MMILSNNPFASLFSALRPTEIEAMKKHLVAVADHDRKKRSSAVRRYRVYLDYLERIGRITEEQRAKLDRHVRPE